jgi:hypothetical protein
MVGAVGELAVALGAQVMMAVGQSSAKLRGECVYGHLLRILYDMRKYVSWKGAADIRTYCCCLLHRTMRLYVASNKSKLNPNEYESCAPFSHTIIQYAFSGKFSRSDRQTILVMRST